jgi:hypothetical protein
LHDPHLQVTLEEHYDYMAKHVDPLLSKALEELLLYQPEQTVGFLADYFGGRLDHKKFNYVVSASVFVSFWFFFKN